MSEVKEYKCPACGAPLYYDINRKSMSCHYCNNVFDLAYILCHFDDVTSEKQLDFDWVERTKYVFEPYEIEKLEGFECPSCGGKIVTKASAATAKCPFCQHDVVISSDFSGDIRPDKVMNGQTGTMRVDKLPTTHLYGHIKPLVFLILLFLEMIFELIVYNVRGVA